MLGLLDDMAALRPTIFVSVPRLLNRIHDKVLAGVREGSFLKRALFAQAYEAKKRAMAEGRPVSAFWDRLGASVRPFLSAPSLTVPPAQSSQSCATSWAAACASSPAAPRPLRQRFAPPFWHGWA